MRSTARRHGMTLIELLVVISILVILIAVAIPVMRPALKDRKVREASRQINTQFALAKSKAAQTGRPWGVWLVRDPNNTNACVQLYIAEQPIPYSGDSLGATATLTTDTNLNPNVPAGYANVAVFSDVQNLVQTGDFIQFNFKGPRYAVTVLDTTKKVTLQPLNGQPWPKLPAQPGDQVLNRMPFQVYRRPVRSNLPPLNVPTGTAVDLAYSGIGFKGFEMNNSVSGNGDIAIMFTPSGAIDSVPGLTFQTPGTIHLLVGRIDQTPALEPAANKSNLADGTASWISIGHLTGTVTTSENFVTDPSAVNVSSAATIAATLTNARNIAQRKQTMGGR